MEASDKVGGGFEQSQSRKVSKPHFIGPRDINYGDIPFYRKRWFAAVLFVFCLPGLILLDQTGDMFAKINNRVYQYTRGYLTKIAAVILMLYFLRFVFEIFD